MVEDASRNPEADSNYYIHLLIESLNKMGRLSAAVESIEQRLPVELRRVVDKTNKEVDQRHPGSMRSSPRRESGKIDLGLGENNVRAVTVFDLLWTLYSKFEAIAEGHRVLHDVIAGIVKREGIQDADSLTGGFNELWKLYQSEVSLCKYCHGGR
jgi:exocyst complex component 4